MAKAPPRPEHLQPQIEKPKVPKHRSPNYPGLTLERAIAKAALMYNSEFRRHAVPLKDGMAKMEYSADSSTGQQALAAMKYYGLVELEGTSDKRQVRVSERAAKIVANHADRDRLIKEAALLPAIHREVWGKFYTEDGLAPDATIRQYLVWDRPESRFSEDAATAFIAQFKQTAQFAKLGGPDKLHDDQNDEVVDPDPEDETETDRIMQDLQAAKREADAKREMAMRSHALPTDLPLPLPMEDGSIRVVSIPRMTAEVFEFFKGQLEAYRKAITQPPTSPQ